MSTLTAGSATRREHKSRRASVYLSASSRMTILCRPAGSVTFFCANILILFRTVSMPLGKGAVEGADEGCG